MERDVVAGERRIDELGRRIAEIDGEMQTFAEKHLRRLGGPTRETAGGRRGPNLDSG